MFGLITRTPDGASSIDADDKAYFYDRSYSMTEARPGRFYDPQNPNQEDFWYYNYPYHTHYADVTSVGQPIVAFDVPDVAVNSGSGNDPVYAEGHAIVGVRRIDGNTWRVHAVAAWDMAGPTLYVFRPYDESPATVEYGLRTWTPNQEQSFTTDTRPLRAQYEDSLRVTVAGAPELDTSQIEFRNDSFNVSLSWPFVAIAYTRPPAVLADSDDWWVFAKLYGYNNGKLIAQWGLIEYDYGLDRDNGPVPSGGIAYTAFQAVNDSARRDIYLLPRP